MSGWRATITAGLAAALLYVACVAFAIGQSITPPAASAPPPDATAPSSRWPMRLNTSDGLITIYQPQLRSFDGNQIKARAAVSVVAPGQQEPVFGAMWMESRVSTDRVQRTVRILDVTVTKVRFPAAGGVTAEALTNAMRAYNATQNPVILSLDQLTAMLQEVQEEKAAANDLSTAPPRILFVEHPAVLVVYDGQPKMMPVANSQLLRAVNTPFFVVQDPATNTYFLKGASFWYSASNPLGPFQPAGQIPAAVSALATSSGYQDPQAPIAGAPASAVEVFTATEPTELIWTDGAEEMATIPNTDLLYVTNTPSDVFIDINSQQIYVLLSGRWYTAPNHNGPWTYIPPDKLPADFAKLPPNSEKANVLASVAGTQQAKDAVADTYIPQTAAIDRHNFEQPPVQYDGGPSFQPIENCPVQYCVNTPSSVLLFGGRYYCCYNACWYIASAPTGPWDICTAVPAEIYTIPPSCPDYACRYCYVYESTPDVVYVGYTPGYTGCYRFDHVVVYGTGFHYGGWVGHEYFPRPWTFGFGAHYDGYSNHWGFEIGRIHSNGEWWFGARARDAVGGFFGHGGYRPVEIRREVGHEQLRDAGFNLYERRKDVRRDIPLGQRPGIRADPGRPEPNERDNVFAGPNGEVYRKTIDGWEERQNGRWIPRGTSGTLDRSHEQPAREPQRQEANRDERSREAPPAELNRDYRARIQGEQRTNSYRGEGGGQESSHESYGGRTGGGAGSSGAGGPRH